jgi:hypothetical protein
MVVTPDVHAGFQEGVLLSTIEALASPFVAGLAALILVQNPVLKSEDVIFLIAYNYSADVFMESTGDYVECQINYFLYSTTRRTVRESQRSSSMSATSSSFLVCKDSTSLHPGMNPRAINGQRPLKGPETDHR